MQEKIAPLNRVGENEKQLFAISFSFSFLGSF